MLLYQLLRYGPLSMALEANFQPGRVAELTACASLYFWVATGFGVGAIALPAQAQNIVVDSPSLGTQLSPLMSHPDCPGNCVQISGGTQQGPNLFHSFERFDIAPTEGALFLDAPGVRQILTRVTGANASNINGFLGTQGASLFILNEQGFIFGANAQLNVAESFVAGVGGRFQAIEPSTNNEVGSFGVGSTDLFSTSPSRLRFEFAPANQGFIRVESGGTTFNPIPGQSISLLAGDVEIQGRRILMPVQQFVIGGSIDRGQVALGDQNKFFVDSSFNAANTAKVVLRGSEIVSDGLTIGGELRIRAHDLDILDSDLHLLAEPDAASFSIANPGIHRDGNIRLVVGGGSVDIVNSRLSSRNASPGSSSGGIHVIDADRLNIQNSELTTATDGNGGNILLALRNTNNLSQTIRQVDLQNSRLLTNATGFSGLPAGRVDVFAEELSLNNTEISTQVTAPVADAVAEINLSSTGPLQLLQNSSLTTSTQGGNTAALVGNISVTADDLQLDRSNISTDGDGAGGRIQLTSRELTLSNGSELLSQAEGSGGDINLQVSETIRHLSGSLIQASATQPGAGEIVLSANELVGELNQNADILYSGLLDESRLNLEDGGTTIDATFVPTDALPPGPRNDFQNHYGPLLPLLPAIDPVVDLPPVIPPQDPAVEPTVEMPTTELEVIPTVEPTAGEDESIRNIQEIAFAREEQEMTIQTCQRRAASRLVLSGRGGIEPSPGSFMSSQSLEDLGVIEDHELSRQPSGSPEDFAPESSASHGGVVVELVEATAWRRNDHGQIQLAVGRSLRPKPGVSCMTQ